MTVARILLQGQEALVPTPDAWREALRVGHVEGVPVPIPERVARWLDEYSSFEEAALAMVRFPGDRWHVVPLLRIAGRMLRVHFENVICEHCNSRCGPSATLDTPSYAGTGLTTAQVWAEAEGMPVQSCPHCRGTLRRRQTLWLAAERA